MPVKADIMSRKIPFIEAAETPTRMQKRAKVPRRKDFRVNRRLFSTMKDNGRRNTPVVSLSKTCQPAIHKTTSATKGEFATGPTYAELAVIHDTSDLDIPSPTFTVSVRTILERCRKTNEAPAKVQTMTKEISCARFRRHSGRVFTAI
jgi:hypothetical protein